MRSVRRRVSGRRDRPAVPFGFGPGSEALWSEPRAPAGDLARVESGLLAAIDSEIGPVSRVCRYLVHAGGKRLRPTLVLLAARFGGAEASRVIPMAVAVELLHTATLYHDDIVDEASIRRARPSANARWGTRAAVFAGGYLFVKAMKLFASAGEAVNRAAAQAIERIWRGQTEETRNAYNLHLDERKFFEIIEQKTSALYELACRIGALAGDLPDRQTNALAAYGRNLGVGFQLVDDILDIVADEASLGKPPGADLRGGIYTLPVIATLARQDAGAARVRGILARHDPRREEIEEVLATLRANGSVDYAVEAARRAIQKAHDQAARLPDCGVRRSLNLLAADVLARADAAWRHAAAGRRSTDE